MQFMAISMIQIVPLSLQKKEGSYNTDPFLNGFLELYASYIAMC
jgi:hypothetical protein